MTCSHSARCAASGNGPTGSRTVSRGLPVDDPLDQPGQPLPHLAEDAVDLGAGHAGLVAVHQRVVLRQAGLRRQQRGLLAGQIASTVAEIGDETASSRWPGAACARRARSARWPSAGAAPATRASALAARHSRRISRRLARCRSDSGSCSARAKRSRQLRRRCACGAAARPSPTCAAARASLPLGGMLAAWSQPASDCRWPRRCRRVQVAASSS